MTDYAKHWNGSKTECDLNPGNRGILLAVTISDSIKLFGDLPGRLQRDGWSVNIVSSPGERLRKEKEEGRLAHAIEMQRRPHPLADLQALVSWVNLLRRLRPSIVSAGTPKAGFLAMFASWIVGIPIRVYELRGLRLETTSGIRRAILFSLERLTCLLATDILAVSTSLRDSTVGMGLASPSKIKVLGHGSSHGVNVHKFRPRETSERLAIRGKLGIVEGIPVLGFIGRFSRDKGAKAILETRRFLVREGIDHYFLVVGEIEDSIDVFEKACRIGRPIIYLQSSPDIPDVIASLDFLLLPSLREGFPNVVLEAAACGVPSVVFDATGSRDAVVDGVTGIVCRLGDQEEFNDAVRRLILESGHCKSLGMAARYRVRKFFEQEGVVQLRLNFYRTIVGWE